MLVYSFVVTLRQRVDDGHDEIQYHRDDELLEYPREHAARFGGRPRTLATMQFVFLVDEELLERLLQLGAHDGDHRQPYHRFLDERLVERDYYKHFLNVHLYYRLAD